MKYRSVFNSAHPRIIEGAPGVHRIRATHQHLKYHALLAHQANLMNFYKSYPIFKFNYKLL